MRIQKLVTEEELLEVVLCAYRCCDDEDDIIEYVESVFYEFKERN